MRAFPNYKGPWSPKEKYCFICGRNADASVDIKGKGLVGVCNGEALGKTCMGILREMLEGRRVEEKQVQLVGGSN